MSIFDTIETLLTPLVDIKAWAVIAPEKDGFLDKRPLNPAGFPVSVSDTSTWATYEACKEAVETGKAAALGFVLHQDAGFTCIDLDRPETEAQAAIAGQISRNFSDTYQEISISGKGLHIFTKSVVPAGVRKGKVEIYSDKRFIIITGNAFYKTPPADIQERVLDVWKTIKSTPKTVQNVELQISDIPDTDIDCAISDAEIVEMALGADNSKKFELLTTGAWQELGYPSQSEADQALINILTFYSHEDSQVVRIFRMTALGKREKAYRRDYMERCLSKARESQPPMVTGLETPPVFQKAETPEPENDIQIFEPEPDIEKSNFTLPPVPVPPGWTGQLATELSACAIRSIPEVGVVSALGSLAAIAGRGFNTYTGTGLNLYLLMVAPTGTGKEGIKTGFDMVVDTLAPHVPAIVDRVGPSGIASGQALIKTLNKRPCFCSILGEFGLEMARLTDKRASGADKALLQAILDLYTKSGIKSRFDGRIYSDSKKDISPIAAPAFSFIGETTDALYDVLSLDMIDSGLLPRVCLMEYAGLRPHANPSPQKELSPALSQQLKGLALTAFSIEARKKAACVVATPDARARLDALDIEADDKINSTKSGTYKQLWNRFHLKILKVSALLAAFDNYVDPVITLEHVGWAEKFCRHDIDTWVQKFELGIIGAADLRASELVKEAIRKYIAIPPEIRAKTWRVPISISTKTDVITHRYLKKFLSHKGFFQKAPQGMSRAVEAAIKDAVAGEILFEIPPADVIAMGCRAHSKVYKIAL